MRYIIEVPTVPARPLTPTQQLLKTNNDNLPVLSITGSFIIGVAFIGQMFVLLSNNSLLKTLRLKDISTFLTTKDIAEQQAMKDLLTDLRLLTDCDRSNLELLHDGVKFNKANLYKQLSIVYESINPEIKSAKNRIKDIPIADIFSEILLQFDKIDKEDINRFRYIVKAKENAEHQASLDSYGIEALLTRVLVNPNGDIIGAIHLEWLQEPRENPMVTRANEINRAFNILNANIQTLIKGHKLPGKYYPKEF